MARYFMTSITMLAAGIMIGSTITAPATPETAAETMAGTTGPPALADGASADSPSLSAGAQWYPWAPGPGELGAGPMAFSIDQVRCCP